jgi:enoyl-CoA hydratase/carnithine racemase
MNLPLNLIDLEYSKRDGVAIATLNRPESLNAFRQQTFADLNAVLEDVRTDASVRVLILTGNGRAFSARADLKEIRSDMLTGERVLADRALEYGMVTQVVEPGELENAAREIASTIAANAPISVRLVKQVLQQSLEGTLEQSLDLETAGMLECLASQDLIEGTQSFIEKRTPVYQGR